jgi:hypothetical protein
MITIIPLSNIPDQVALKQVAPRAFNAERVVRDSEKSSGTPIGRNGGVNYN